MEMFEQINQGKEVYLRRSSRHQISSSIKEGNNEPSSSETLFRRQTIHLGETRCKNPRLLASLTRVLNMSLQLVGALHLYLCHNRSQASSVRIMIYSTSRWRSNVSPSSRDLSGLAHN